MTGTRPPDKAPFDRAQDWLLGDLLGSGGFGSVYLGEWSNPLTPPPTPSGNAAIKLLGATENDTARVIAEANIGRTLQHQNVLRTYNAFMVGPNAVLVLELAEYSLETLLAGKGPLKAGALTELTEQLVAGLAFLHGQGIVHGDIKPSNVLFANGSWKLADFGVSSELGNQTSAIAHGIDLDYTAPEHSGANQPRIRAASDLWALGVTLHKAATGVHPCPGSSPAEVFRSAASGKYQISTSLSEPTKSVVESCLRFSPDERPKDAAAISLTQHENRRKLATWKVATALLAAVIGATGTWFAGHSGQVTPPPPTTTTTIASTTTPATSEKQPIVEGRKNTSTDCCVFQVAGPLTTILDESSKVLTGQAGKLSVESGFLPDSTMTHAREVLLKHIDPTSRVTAKAKPSKSGESSIEGTLQRWEVYTAQTPKGPYYLRLTTIGSDCTSVGYLILTWSRQNQLYVENQIKQLSTSFAMTSCTTSPTTTVLPNILSTIKPSAPGTTTFKPTSTAPSASPATTPKPPTSKPSTSVVPQPLTTNIQTKSRNSRPTPTQNSNVKKGSELTGSTTSATTPLNASAIGTTGLPAPIPNVERTTPSSTSTSPTTTTSTTTTTTTTTTLSKSIPPGYVLRMVATDTYRVNVFPGTVSNQSTSITPPEFSTAEQSGYSSPRVQFDQNLAVTPYIRARVGYYVDKFWDTQKAGMVGFFAVGSQPGYTDLTVLYFNKSQSSICGIGAELSFVETTNAGVTNQAQVRLAWPFDIAIQPDKVFASIVRVPNDTIGPFFQDQRTTGIVYNTRGQYAYPC